MSATASRLIASYGKSMTLVRNNDSIDPVTGVNTPGSDQQFSVNGIFKLYPDNLIDGTRITASDRLIVLDNGVEPLLTDTIEINGALWPIEEIKTSEPADDTLVYFVRVRR